MIQPFGGPYHTLKEGIDAAFGGDVLLLRPGTNLIWMVVSALASWPGPFAPMGGRWMLINV